MSLLAYFVTPIVKDVCVIRSVGGSICYFQGWSWRAALWMHAWSAACRNCQHISCRWAFSQSFTPTSGSSPFSASYCRWILWVIHTWGRGEHGDEIVLLEMPPVLFTLVFFFTCSSLIVSIVRLHAVPLQCCCVDVTCSRLFDVCAVFTLPLSRCLQWLRGVSYPLSWRAGCAHMGCRAATAATRTTVRV